MLSCHCLNNAPFIHSKRFLSDYYESVAILDAGDTIMNIIKIKNIPCSHSDYL